MLRVREERERGSAPLYARPEAGGAESPRGQVGDRDCAEGAGGGGAGGGGGTAGHGGGQQVLGDGVAVAQLGDINGRSYGPGMLLLLPLLFFTTVAIVAIFSLFG